MFALLSEKSLFQTLSERKMRECFKNADEDRGDK